MKDPPTFTRLLGAGSDPSDKTISVMLGVDEESGLQLNLNHALIGPLIAVLAAEANKLNAILPDEDRGQSVTLNATAVWLSQDDEGHPMLVFELPSGTLLPLAMRSGDFAGLAAEMALLAAEPPGSPH